MNTAATPPTLQAARWATDLSTALGVDEITTTGGSGPEIVTATSPRMMTRPVTEPASAASASCQTTDDTAAARVGDMVTVEHRGICDRVATGMVTKRDLDDRYSGDQVATINGQSVTVGGSTTIDTLTTAGGLVASRASGSSGELETRTSSGTQRTYMRPSGVSGTSGWFVGAGVEGRLELSSPLAPAIYGLAATSSPSAQTLKLNISSGGLPLIYFESSLRRIKVGIADAALDPNRILGLRVREWTDRGELARYRNARHGDGRSCDGWDPDRRPSRVIGLVAEEVEAAGLGQLCTRTENGELTGVAYDRLAVLLIPIVAELRDQVAELTARLAQLDEQPTP